VKAFLLHRDRDFDPQQLIARREKELRPRYSGPPLDLEQILPWNQAALTQDLGLDVVIDAMAKDDPFLFEVAKVALLSSLTDPDAINYRQEIFRDCLKNADVVNEIYRIALEAIANERKNYWSYFSRSPGSILHRAVEVLQMFVRMLKRLRSIADGYSGKFSSEGFDRLFAMLMNELTDGYFTQIEKRLKELRFRGGVLISAQLRDGNKGTHYALRKPHADKRAWPLRLLPFKPQGYTFQLHPRDEAGARALAALNDQGLNLVANALAQSVDHILGFFQMLRTELAFYIGCLNLHRRLTALGEPVCLPVARPAGDGTLSFAGLYDPSLTLSMGRKVVGNDLASRHKSLLIITGANTGGKSTFLRSLGLAQLMLQAGMFVAAEAFTAEARDGVFTHYKREEDAAMESGKWDEELGRMSAIVDRIKPNAFVLFNESFASTNEREGSEIASQITRALLEKGVKVAFVTHLYHFARNVFDRRLPGALFLLAERRPDGTRPFRLVEAAPLQTSYGEDLYAAIFAGSERTHNTRELA